ncbi:MAG TPA: DUF2071 domain-containing protein [Candidatus Polarisedimenticolia bacterium]|nr:DUF2071 domain-containing protein [Candidatus Polarisedimenticolia bacterium]
MSGPAGAAAALSLTDHRPWALPEQPWAWRQSWLDLLFAHWPMPAAALRPLVPQPLALQEFDGRAWIGVVPFRMTGVMRRPLPDIPGVSAFAEMNVRTYVTFDGKPGVWFLSLDANNALAVWAARRWFHLPYHRARMSIAAEGEGFRYASARPGAVFRATYGPVSEVFRASVGSLEHFLTERYCLYACAPDGAIARTDVHHRPWPLQRATASIEVNSMLEAHGLETPPVPPLVHFARRLDVVVWNPERVA